MHADKGVPAVLDRMDMRQHEDTNACIGRVPRSDAAEQLADAVAHQPSQTCL
jgi:hypothetical protein